MSDRMRINETVVVGPQPAEGELSGLASDFKSVVNLRTDGEDEQSLSPSAEGEVLRAAGVEYLHFPVAMESLSPELVDRFRETFAALPTPVFAHCESGKRAGAMVMMDMAVRKGMTGRQTLEKAEEMGFECDQPELVEFVQSYVDSRTG